MATDNKILINVIGTGYDVCVGEITPQTKEIFNAAVEQENKPLNHLLFDNDFYKKYPIANSYHFWEYSNWKDFDDKAVYRGANLLEYGQMEIWINKKKVKTYKFHELISNATLFPLFDANEELLTELLTGSNLLIGVQEKGHLAKFTIKSFKFIPEELQLHIVNFTSGKSNIKLLYKITYFGKALISLKQDTVVTGTVFNLF